MTPLLTAVATLAAVLAGCGIAYVLLCRWRWRQWAEREAVQFAADRAALEQYFDYRDEGDGTVTMAPREPT